MTTLNDLKNAALQGRINRRDFIQQATALGLTAAAAGTLADSSALKREVVEGLDILILRELTGGVYFGEPKEITDLGNGQKRAIDTQVYDTFEIERMIQHFRCSYSGLESEFVEGLELVCPKCSRKLDTLGQDFDRPHEVYVCKAAGHLFEDPLLEDLSQAKEQRRELVDVFLDGRRFDAGRPGT